MIEYKWIIEQMTVHPTEDGYTNTLETIYWRCNATDGTFASTEYGSVTAPDPNVRYVPYSELTEQGVLEMCWSTDINKEDIEANLAKAIEYHKSPLLITLPLPWAISAVIEEDPI